MVSLEISTEPPPPPITTSPRISFSSDFLDETNFISISPHSHQNQNQKQHQKEREKADFEFLNSTNTTHHKMLSADELFFDGKLLPFWQVQQFSEKLNKMSLKTKETQREEEVVFKEKESESSSNRANNSNNNWFVDDDPSPRPPKCTVLWKELLRLKKQRANSSLSPSSSTSSSSSSSSADMVVVNNNTEEKKVKRLKKGLERTRSASIRIRPMINVPICTAQVKNSALPPLFPLKKGRLERS